MRPAGEIRFPPVPGEGATGHRIDDKSGIRGTCTTVYARACSTIDGVLARHLSDRGGITTSARKIPRVIRSVNVKNINETMGMC